MYSSYIKNVLIMYFDFACDMFVHAHKCFVDSQYLLFLFDVLLMMINCVLFNFPAC